ncbi:hypothetical protein GPZ77_33970 [Streptomyces sp. QHH-9511]|uniref:hypothetical protein n=1 Tax=Streptomyces sp. QHH-9511 TaxID=2684468 RepID=UPI0013163511|nr:hypothetical protein [Streptomyces sp. QHH-9511]QGZ52633.1 hypothetical protein GPZ77_33970 [Streptomyces sp. QHH-9511]
MNRWTRGAAGAALGVMLLLTGCETSDDPHDAKPQNPAELAATPGGTDLDPVVGEWKETGNGGTPWTLRISADGKFSTSDGSDTCEGGVQAVPSEADKTWRHFLAQVDCGWAGQKTVTLRLGQVDGEERLILTNDEGQGSKETYQRVG